MDRTAVIALSLVTTLGTDVSAQGYRAQENALLLCYTTAALTYALQTCERTATLIDAVFGKCAVDERKLQDAVERSEHVGVETSTVVIRQVRDDAKPKLISLIIDTRLKSGNSCH